MCFRYVAPTPAVIDLNWPNLTKPESIWSSNLFPDKPGPFIRNSSSGLELVVGLWGLIAPFATSPKSSYSTFNARSEDLLAKPTFRDAWKSGQRCIIPAISFDEPCWESGKNVWWRFARSDGQPWALAGLWNRWTDKSTRAIWESYTMLTINADEHPLMSRMHKPDPKLPPNAQDKRSVIPLECDTVHLWLTGSLEQAKSLLKLCDVERFSAQALTPPSPTSLF